jgi:Flp pilus assembly protein protease CpaA
MLICVPLLIATYFDLRFREVPAWLTLTALLESGAYAVFNGFWMPALLTVALCLVSEITIPVQRRSFAAVISAFSAIFLPSSTIACLALFSIWLLWDLGHIGGADLKLMIAATLAFGSPAVLIPITIVGGFQGGAALLRKRTTVPYVLSIFLGTLVYTLGPLIL